MVKLNNLFDKNNLPIFRDYSGQNSGLNYQSPMSSHLLPVLREGAVLTAPCLPLCRCCFIHFLAWTTRRSMVSLSSESDPNKCLSLVMTAAGGCSCRSWEGEGSFLFAFRPSACRVIAHDIGFGETATWPPLNLSTTGKHGWGRGESCGV